MPEYRKGQRVRIKHGRDRGKLGTVFGVDRSVVFVIADGDHLDISYRATWLEPAPVSGDGEDR